ncbi:MAG: hypothetical protein JO227_04530 [Acetobacteraceae bacterium]|nr:hypothetical protein [Acetobacteraceae bacterium]
MPRIPPITGKPDVAPEYHDVVDAIISVFGTVRGPFSMLLRSPELAKRLLPLVPFFREQSVVEPRLRMFGVLAAVREREAAYVWAAQVALAHRIGFPEDAIDLLRAKGDPSGLPPEERHVVLYARQLMRTNRVEQAVFDAMRGRRSEQWMVELTAAINFYAMLCGIVNAFEVPAPADGDRLPD